MNGRSPHEGGKLLDAFSRHRVKELTQIVDYPHCGNLKHQRPNQKSAKHHSDRFSRLFYPER
jgi:hypothetical protein